jgi:hypothetical protein
MHNKGMIEYFPKCNLEVDFCEHCIYGKKNRVWFPSRETREKGILELIHSDVFGPVIAHIVGWKKPDPIQKSETTMGVTTHSHLR